MISPKLILLQDTELKSWMSKSIETMIECSLLQFSAVNRFFSFIMKSASFLLQNNGMYPLSLQLPMLCVLKSCRTYSLLWGVSTAVKEGFAGRVIVNHETCT